jgi:hypothetical protein
LKLPGSTTYTRRTLGLGAVVAPIVPDTSKAYACYADVSFIGVWTTNAQDRTYTVADRLVLV